MDEGNDVSDMSNEQESIKKEVEVNHSQGKIDRRGPKEGRNEESPAKSRSKEKKRREEQRWRVRGKKHLNLRKKNRENEKLEKFLNQRGVVVWKRTRKCKGDVEGAGKSGDWKWKKDGGSRCMICWSSTTAREGAEPVPSVSKIGFSKGSHRPLWRKRWFSSRKVRKRRREKADGDHCRKRQRRWSEIKPWGRRRLKGSGEEAEELEADGQEGKENKRRKRSDRRRRQWPEKARTKMKSKGRYQLNFREEGIVKMRFASHVCC